MIYSTLMRRRTGNLFVSFLTITFLCLTSTSVNAQMFSIDTAEQTQSRPAMFRTTAGVGLSFASFTFQGDDSYESDLEFNNNLININFSTRSDEHTSELQSRGHLVCRLLLEKKKETVRKTKAPRALVTRALT